jgi:transcriptional regulator
MALYVPRSFAIEDRATLDALIDEHPFATLVTPASPEPYVTHLPLLRDGDGALLGHFARANPHARHAEGATSLAIFHGPHAYVSPTWYEDPDNAVPTWNFATVHVHGTMACLGDADAERIVAMLVERFEGSAPGAWRFAMQGRPRAAMIANIQAFRLSIASITGKHKLSQNRGASDRRRVIASLAQSEYADAQATSAWMQRFAAPDDA